MMLLVGCEMLNKIYVNKCIEVDDCVLQNILFDAFVSCGYSDTSARISAEKVIDIPRYVEYNVFTGTKITKERLIKAISRYIASNDETDIMLISDNAREIVCSIPT